MRRANTKTVQNETKWYSRQYGIYGLNTLQGGFPLTAKKLFL